jgi:hypothetical protein
MEKATCAGSKHRQTQQKRLPRHAAPELKGDVVAHVASVIFDNKS